MVISTSFRKPYQAPRCGRYPLTPTQDLLVAGSVQRGRGLEHVEYVDLYLLSLYLFEL